MTSRRYEVPKVLPTTVVGSYPKFEVAKEALRRYRKGDIGEEELDKAIMEATKLVVKDYLNAGIDIISDGEQRREDMAVFFAERLEGFRISGWVRVFDNIYFRKPVVIGEVKFKRPITVKDWKYALAFSKGRPVKGIITGPYTMADWSFNEYYKEREELVIDLARALHEEVKELERAGAKYIQVDEPALSTHRERQDMELAREALREVFKGINAKRIIHICYGKLERLFPDLLEFPVDQVDLEMKNSGYRLLPVLKEYSFDKELGLGVVDVHTLRVESVEEVVRGIKMALEVIGPEKIYVDPDCGLKLLPREIALSKLKVMVEAVRKVRKELGSE
ncbi:MAG: methylcobamide--CoM methyltransferase [Thermofilum sp. ex4484_15]|nr:MAG: methylcobamide--CoM methyltransferase [Thermofilum sp. ex4484_15]